MQVFLNNSQNKDYSENVLKLALNWVIILVFAT